MLAMRADAWACASAITAATTMPFHVCTISSPPPLPPCYLDRRSASADHGTMSHPISANDPSAFSVGGGGVHGPDAQITVDTTTNDQNAIFAPRVSDPGARK